MSLLSRLRFRKKPSMKVVFVKSSRNSTDVWTYFPNEVLE